MHMVLAGSAAFNRTDAGNGEYFARLYGDRLRYDHRRGRWLLWNGHWWRDDETRTVRRMAIREELNYTIRRRVIELPPRRYRVKVAVP